MSKYFDKGEFRIHLGDSQTPPESNFIGREDELRLCRAAFGMTSDAKLDSKLTPLHFRLEGPPGVGKNEIVYELARQLANSMNLPFYSIQGHEEMTPEDLSLLIVPDADARDYMQFRVQASPLATALYEGGLFFFDEINRVSERALSPLASVLDKRQELYSATTGLTITPKNHAAKSNFRFCCALNPSLSKAGGGTLPDYIDERTLPVIRVDYLKLETLVEILRSNVTTEEAILGGFKEWYTSQIESTISVRQANALTIYAMRTATDTDSLQSAFSNASKHILRPEQIRD